MAGPGDFLTRPWGEQPQYAPLVRQDFSAPLVFAWLPSVGYVNLARSEAARTISAPPVLGAIHSGIAYGGSSRAEFPQLLEASSGLTFISVFRSRSASDYTFSDGSRYLASNRPASNAGWSFGRYAGVAGGALGNLTRLEFTLQGVAQYLGPNVIPSQQDTPVAVRYNKTAGLVSWFDFGRSSAADTAASTSPSTGSNLVVGAQGDYAANVGPWIDRSTCLLIFAGALSNAEIWYLSESAQAPYRAFAPRRIFVPGAAAGGVPALSLSTYAPGSLASSGWTPRITAS